MGNVIIKLLVIGKLAKLKIEMISTRCEANRMMTAGVQGSVGGMKVAGVSY